MAACKSMSEWNVPRWHCQGNGSVAPLSTSSGADRHVSYKRHRFLPEVIRYAVWLYFRFALNSRDVEELMAERGVVVSYETTRRWTRKFGR